MACAKERERERERDRQTDRQRDRESEKFVFSARLYDDDKLDTRLIGTLKKSILHKGNGCVLFYYELAVCCFV